MNSGTKAVLLLIRLSCFCLAVLLAGTAAAQIPLEQEPHHHLEFVSDSLRVISPQIPPGESTLEHMHTHDDVTICIHPSQVRAKVHGGEWSNPGVPCVLGTANLTEYTGQPRSHTVQNLGSEIYHLLMVENLREGGWTRYGALNIEGLKVLRENRSFRIYETDLSASAVLEHSHKVPTVVVLVSGEVTAGDKRLDLAGSWTLVPAGDKHQIAARSNAHIVEIEVR